MATITVRQVTPDDATELARMLDLFDSMGATPEQVAARMLACQNVLTTFIGELDGQPVGFACLRLMPHLQGDEPYAELTDIYVDASFRRKQAKSAFIPRLVPAERLTAANSLDSVSSSIVSLIAPSLGGALFVLLGLSGVVLVDSASFLLSGLLIALIVAPSAARLTLTLIAVVVVVATVVVVMVVVIVVP